MDVGGPEASRDERLGCSNQTAQIGRVNATLLGPDFPRVLTVASTPSLRPGPR